MNEDFEEQLTQTLFEVDPHLQLERLNVRSLGTLQEFLVFGSSLVGIISSLWKLSDAWRSEHRHNNIHVEYTTGEGRHVTLELANRTKQEVDEFLAKNPPKQDSSAKLSLENAPPHSDQK